MIISLTDHAIKRAIERNERIKNEKKANGFLCFHFKFLYKKYKDKESHKDKQVRVYKGKRGCYVLVHGKHKYVFKKYLGEINIITYSKQNKEKEILKLFRKLKVNNL